MMATLNASLLFCETNVMGHQNQRVLQSLAVGYPTYALETSCALPSAINSADFKLPEYTTSNAVRCDGSQGSPCWTQTTMYLREELATASSSRNERAVRIANLGTSMSFIERLTAGSEWTSILKNSSGRDLSFRDNPDDYMNEWYAISEIWRI